MAKTLLQQLVEEMVDRDEFEGAFKAAMKFITNSLTKLEKKIDTRLAQVKDGKDGARGPKGDRGEKGDTGRSIFGGKGEQGEQGPAGSPDTSEQVRDKLETLEDDERLSLSAVKGLEDEIAKLRKEIATKSSGGARRVFQPYIDRFTAQTDGVTKTFYLKREPLRTDTIEVSGTDFPIILDPTVDFTVAGKTLTLAAGIPAPSAGATLIVKYYA